MLIKSMQKAVVIKQTWEIILMIPHHLLEASGVPACIYIAARRLDYCAHEASLVSRPHEEEQSGEPSRISWASARFCDVVT